MTMVDQSICPNISNVCNVNELLFVVGRVYGFRDEIYQKANFRLSLSKMTFIHDIIRITFLEQLYRAFTIINYQHYQH